MIDFIQKIFGENWKTTLTGIVILLFTLGKCLLSGGNFVECLATAQNAVQAIVGFGFLAASDTKPTK